MGRALLTLGQMVAGHARLRPDSLGARDLERSLTFDRWNQRACRLGNALLGLGLTKGDRVAVLAYNCIEWAEIYVAVAKAGLIAVPINFRLSAPEAAFIVTDARAAAIIAQDALCGLIEEVRDDLGIADGRFIHFGADGVTSIYSRASLDPEHCPRTLGRAGATFTSLVPTHYIMTLGLPGGVRDKPDLGRVSMLMISSALAAALRRALDNAPALVDVVTSQTAVSSDAQKGLGFVPDYQPLTAWDDAERRRRGLLMTAPTRSPRPAALASPCRPRSRTCGGASAPSSSAHILPVEADRRQLRRARQYPPRRAGAAAGQGQGRGSLVAAGADGARRHGPVRRRARGDVRGGEPLDLRPGRVQLRRTRRRQYRRPGPPRVARSSRTNGCSRSSTAPSARPSR